MSYICSLGIENTHTNVEFGVLHKTSKQSLISIFFYKARPSPLLTQTRPPHPPGGGGVLGIHIGGGVPWHTKKGGLRCGHSPKVGVLGAGTSPKKGGLRCGHNHKKGVLDTSTTRKRGNL